MGDPRHRLGSRGEAAVVAHLESEGYAIVATNLRVGKLEIDIVARKEDVVVIVEVRTRGEGAWTTGFGSIDGRKRERIRRAGERLWNRRYRGDETVNHLRFDAASVTFDASGHPTIEYAPAAF